MARVSFTLDLRALREQVSAAGRACRRAVEEVATTAEGAFSATPETLGVALPPVLRERGLIFTWRPEAA